MTVTSIYYEKCFPLGGYSNEKIGMGVTLAEGDNPVEAFALCKKEVEKAHRFFIDYPNYLEAKKAVGDKENITPRQLSAYEMLIQAFENNYPEHLSKFTPVSKQITNGYDDGISE